MRAQIPTGLTIMGIQLPQSKITGTKVPIIQMQIKVLQKGTPQKDADSSIGELFTNRKWRGSKDDGKPPLKGAGRYCTKLTMTWVYKKLRGWLWMNS